MFDHFLESSHRDDSNKWSNIIFGVEMSHEESIEVNCMDLIWSSGITVKPVLRDHIKEVKLVAIKTSGHYMKSECIMHTLQQFSA